MITREQINQDQQNESKQNAYPQTHRVGTAVLNACRSYKLDSTLTQALCDMYEAVGEIEHGGSTCAAEYGATFRRGMTEELYMEQDNQEEIDKEAMEGIANVVIDMITTMALLYAERRNNRPPAR